MNLFYKDRNSYTNGLLTLSCRKELLCNFIEVTLLHGSSPVNLLNIFRTSFYKSTFDGLLLNCHDEDPFRTFVTI